MNLLVRNVTFSTSLALAALIGVENAEARPLRYRAAPVDYSVSDQHHIIPQVIGRDTKGDMLYHH